MLLFMFILRLVLHIHQLPRDSDDADTENGVFVWTSVSEPVDNVVPMYYDDDSDQISDAMVENDSKFTTIEELARHRPGPISTACMCKREVVGCAVCGSPLGMRYSPCSSAVKKIFPPFGHIASPPHPRRTFISSRSPAVYPSSYPRPASLDADAESYRSRVADYLLAMSTPRSTRTAPSPPDTVRLTPEMHNESDHSRPFEVSILPRRVSSQNHQRQPSSSSREPLNGSTRLHSRPSAIEDYRNEVQSEPQQRPLQTLESLVTELTETETIDSETEAESDNDDHYRLPMITQTPLGRDSGCPSGHWARGSPERHVYRFFAEAVVAEALSKKTSLEESTGCPPSMTDWRRLYASLYGLGLRSEGDDRRLSCG
ncbi:hypothetical protein BDP27DRAFT_7522 [Rhodocollybia butyracea]|uniref:Uncharacterized protein n=1 Tax=Rhodocollybia butyracea TaxID=206335 RepID=A0A9P5QAR1_9AGAR|nr:hypothetical protein BDP27DRAFT_7522 [Rhodocollybia butyracea]